jgi:hypothetical protein
MLSSYTVSRLKSLLKGLHIITPSHWPVLSKDQLNSLGSINIWVQHYRLCKHRCFHWQLGTPFTPGWGEVVETKRFTQGDADSGIRTRDQSPPDCLSETRATAPPHWSRWENLHYQRELPSLLHMERWQTRNLTNCTTLTSLVVKIKLVDVKRVTVTSVQRLWSLCCVRTIGEFKVGVNTCV